MIKSLLLFVTVLFFGITLIFWNASDTKLKAENARIVHISDSVIQANQEELYNLVIDNGRYEIILERVYQMDSNLYNKAIENVE